MWPRYIYHPDLDVCCYHIASLRCGRNRSVCGRKALPPFQEARGLMLSLLADLEGLSACSRGVAFCLSLG